MKFIVEKYPSALTYNTRVAHKWVRKTQISLQITGFLWTHVWVIRRQILGGEYTIDKMLVFCNFGEPKRGEHSTSAARPKLWDRISKDRPGWGARLRVCWANSRFQNHELSQCFWQTRCQKGQAELESPRFGRAGRGDCWHEKGVDMISPPH